MTQPVELAELLAETMPEANRENSDLAYKSKLVTVRRLQSKGMPDASIEKALDLTIQDADRVAAEIGDPANLLFRVRWDSSTRRGTDARNIQGNLEILIRGEPVRAREQDPPSWKFLPEPTLELLSKSWADLLLETETSRDQANANEVTGVNLTPVLKAHANNRRLTIRVTRAGNLFSFFVGKQKWRVEFGGAIAALEKFGQLLHERLASSPADQWSKRADIKPEKALALAAGLPRAALLKYLERQLQVLGEKFDLSSLAYNIPELVVVARMSPAHLSDSDVKQLLKWVAEVPSHEASNSVSEASNAARTWLDRHYDPSWKEFDEGYAVANWFRRYQKIDSDNETVEVEKILASWNVGVTSREFAPSLDAVAVWGKSHGPTIIVNKNGVHSHSIGGLRATLAHEMCHILLDRKSALPVVEVLGGRVAQGIETRARAFAAELLLPRSAANRIVRTSFNVQAAVEQLVEHYRVSAALAAWQITNSKPQLSSSELDWLKGLAHGPNNKSKRSIVFEPVP
jgi:Zn-dependent peptidase ImmA (M78 family)